MKILAVKKNNQLRDFAVCRLTLLNARRGGEPSRMTVKDQEDALQSALIDEARVKHVEDDVKKAFV